MIESHPSVGILKVALFLPASQSLKEKRMVLKSLKDRARSRFNVSIAEIEHHDKWQRTVLALIGSVIVRKCLAKKLLHFSC